MTPSELRLFTKNEQALLVDTERKRLDPLTEDELDELFTRVRRARNKYLKLYRRQSATLVADHASRAGTDSSNQRTYRKAEIFEDALARVARALATAARATSKQLKEERLAAAAAATGAPLPAGEVPEPKAQDSGSSRPKEVRGRASSRSRQAARASEGARKQARRDRR